VEYIAGSLITLVIVVVLNKLMRRHADSQLNTKKIRYSQSHIYSMVSEILEREFELPKLATQSQKYIENTYVKVMIVDEEAYWIKDNRLFVAKMNEGEVDKESTREVDTMSMSKVQLEKTMFVVEKLTEGENDTGNSGDKKV